MAVELRQVQDKLATAEDERDEAREEKRTWVEAAGNELAAQRREIERLLTERDEAQRKLAVAVAALTTITTYGTRAAAIAQAALARIRGDK